MLKIVIPAAILMVVSLVALGLFFGGINYLQNKQSAGQAYKSLQTEQISEDTQTPSSSSSRTSYIYAGKRVAELGANGITYYHDDHLGSHSLITDAAGQVTGEFKNYPFGETVLSSNSRYSYTGKELDDTRLYYYGARFYNPTIGRFTQVDPELTTDSNYAYAANNPFKYIDPDGRDIKFIVDPKSQDKISPDDLKSLTKQINLILSNDAFIEALGFNPNKDIESLTVIFTWSEIGDSGYVDTANDKICLNAYQDTLGSPKRMGITLWGMAVVGHELTHFKSDKNNEFKSFVEYNKYFTKSNIAKVPKDLILQNNQENIEYENKAFDTMQRIIDTLYKKGYIDKKTREQESNRIARVRRAQIYDWEKARQETLKVMRDYPNQKEYSIEQKKSH